MNRFCQIIVNYRVLGVLVFTVNYSVLVFTVKYRVLVFTVNYRVLVFTGTRFNE